MRPVFHLFCALAIGMAAGAWPSMGQRSATGPESGGSNPSDSVPGTPGATPGTLPRAPGLRVPGSGSAERAIYVSGRVLLEDGTPPPDSVVIERVCNGLARPEGYTDSKGRFSFQIGQNSTIMADAGVNSGTRVPGMSRSRGSSSGGGSAVPDLTVCEIRASLPGYRSAPVSLAGRRVLDNPEIGTIVLHRLANVEGRTVSVTSLEAPKDARKAYEKGLAAARKEKFEEARKEFRKAVDSYPKYAAAWYELGRLHEHSGGAQEARQSYAQALAADPKFVKPYLQLADISVREKNWREVSDVTARIIRLDPLDFPQAYLYGAVASYNLRNLPAAEDSARRGHALDGEHRFPRISYVLAVILAEKGDSSGAAEHLREYLKFAVDTGEAARARELLKELEALVANPPKE